MTTRHALLALAAVTLVACGGEPEAPAETTVSPVEVLPNIAMPPDGQLLASEGGAEAATLLMSTPMAVDTVIAYYRDVLSQPPYRLINESVNGAVTSFYVEQDGPPLWITVEGLEAPAKLDELFDALD